ncbi:acetolactate synthase small subunit [Miniphocaeibacter massiliensis]|uniref:acetolactate synthase small subunit n=1 Tax=Miniphocaeibacter massiliensis TaxID=2041841 RepID=UPI000C1B8B73|nr:acetolactate synthase small subunit [Miniphocaeibacter massiliensis]
MEHTISVIVENKSGVLTRVSGLFSRRGYNIESLAVGETDVPGISRMTIVVNGDERIIEQVEKQLYKLIDVIKVIHLTDEEFVERELVLIKLSVSKSTRTEILQVVDIFRAKVIDMNVSSFVIEATGTTSKISALEKALRPYGIREIVRTGMVALSRGAKKSKGVSIR